MGDLAATAAGLPGQVGDRTVLLRLRRHRAELLRQRVQGRGDLVLLAAALLADVRTQLVQQAAGLAGGLPTTLPASCFAVPATFDPASRAVSLRRRPPTWPPPSSNRTRRIRPSLMPTALRRSIPRSPKRSGPRTHRRQHAHPPGRRLQFHCSQGGHQLFGRCHVLGRPGTREVLGVLAEAPRPVAGIGITRHSTISFPGMARRYPDVYSVNRAKFAEVARCPSGGSDRAGPGLDEGGREGGREVSLPSVRAQRVQSLTEIELEPVEQCLQRHFELLGTAILAEQAAELHDRRRAAQIELTVLVGNLRLPLIQRLLDR